MALISCPECARTISDMAVFCPNCGYPMSYPVNNPLQIMDTLPTVIPAKANRGPKKRRKLPNGSGSIKHLSGRRSKPWAAYPPVTIFTLNGSPVLKPAIGYFKTYNEAYQALMVYSGAPDGLKQADVSFADLCAAMLANRSAAVLPECANITFAELYERYFDNKYNKSKKKFSKAAQYSSKAAFQNCKKIHGRKFADLRKADLQDIIDTCPLKHSSLELIASLFKGMYAYAIQNDIVEKDYSRFVSINIPDDDESGVPFSADAIDILWKNKHKKDVGMVLLMIYTGFRIAAYKTIRYDEAGQYFQGGIKTAAGKNRIVPLHPAIQGFAKDFANRYFAEGAETFTAAKCRAEFYKVLNMLGIATSASHTKHTPHDCRHTFSWLCDKYGVDDLSKHLLMGHSLGNDIEKSVYGHRTIDELRAEIEKIEVPDFVSI